MEEAPVEEKKEEIPTEATYSDFAKLELKVGLVKSAEILEKSEKLLRLTVDFGTEERQVLSGIRKFYSPEDVVGKKFVFVTNLQRRKIMGLESQAMIMAAEDENGIVLLQPEKDITPGSKVC
ncbi:MAG: methionine--tRNA ligase subunit beta [Candidatus Aenigmarchaeota archaeon]|nr:methionine--tRNA ligase subunit beta [Candidatus Aenigmarchaeota archaeon]